jgi:DNA-binding transcriptional LysR family regulator
MMNDSLQRTALDDLATLRIFMAVVETGSFTKAGKRLQVVPSTISKHISSLEDKLNAQLIIRSTKELSVTELGLHFYDRCQAVLQAVMDAESEISQYQGEVRGTLRVSCAPALLVTDFISMVDRFLLANPKVKVVLDVSSMAQDLISEGFDVAVRMNNVSNPDLIALKLAEFKRVVCASTSYLEKHGRPGHVEDLVDHNCLVISNLAYSANWPFLSEDGEEKTVTVSGNLITNSAAAVVDALLNNFGVGLIGRGFVHKHLESGKLIDLFPEQNVMTSKVFAVYSERKHLPLKTRAFLDHLKKEFSVPPWPNHP